MAPSLSTESGAAAPADTPWSAICLPTGHHEDPICVTGEIGPWADSGGAPCIEFDDHGHPSSGAFSALGVFFL